MNRALRMGLVGVGRVARKHLRAYEACGVELVVVCDVEEGAARGVGGGVRVYRDAYRMIREAGVEAVDICTPHAEHAGIAIAAAEAGKHVLCQKPMGCSMEECEAVVGAAEKAGVTLMVGMSHRFEAGNVEVKRAIEEGRIGAVKAVRLETMMDLPGAVGEEHWIYDGQRAGGGVLMCLGLQKIDLARFWVGEIKRVSAVCRRTHPWFRHGAEDVAMAMMEFENGAVGELFASFTAGEWGEGGVVMGKRGSLGGEATERRSDEATKGKAEGKGQNAKRKTQNAEGEEGGGEEGAKGDMFGGEMGHFVECCREGREPVCSGRENLGTMRVVFAMYEAAREGRAVEVGN